MAFSAAAVSASGFCIEATCEKARVGKLYFPRGLVATPVFMPVATQGSLKAILHSLSLPYGLLLANTYHLYLRPGIEIIQKAGGLHAFMNWQGSILTDSGGYQVYSLASLRTLTKEGVIFKSHLDGSKHLFTPEKVVGIQGALGSDIQMALDVCPPYPVSERELAQALELTHAWALRARKYFLQQKEEGRIAPWIRQFGIVQGSTDTAQRHLSASFLAELDFEGYAIGGLAVGEPAVVRYEVTQETVRYLPWEKPRYLMGVGTPQDILEAIGAGVDMMDCVLPTREARHGRLYSWQGIYQIKNARYKADFTPLAQEGLLANFTRAYLRHLFHAQEPLALTLASLHNLLFYAELLAQVRFHIQQGDFYAWKEKVIPQLMQVNPD
ncbi:MAG: tRNA guanosine(34) transglycosylase Tgt [Bacteroidia bacterium]